MEENQEIEKNEVLEVVNDAESAGIKISDEVVATIAGMAASEVSGVANMSGGFVDGILGKKTKGVKVQVGEKETTIDISLVVEYGARIPDVAWEVQNKVKTQVESMTGLKVVAVNVIVQGVNFPKEAKKKVEEVKEQENNPVEKE